MTDAADNILVCVLVNSERVFLNSLTIGSLSSILQQMPITRSAKKKLRQDKKRQKYNLLVKKTVKDAIKSFRRKPTNSLLPKVFSIIDTAAKKKIYHPNKVARLKSNLAKLMGNKPSPHATGAAKKSARKKTEKKT